MPRHLLRLVFLAVTLLPSVVYGFQVSASLSAQKVSLTQTTGKIDVQLGGKLFTRLDFKTYAKPILYPIFAPGQIGMTRNWPMKKDAVGESRDHSHHKSMWVGHEINGKNFWTEKEGQVETSLATTKFSDGTQNAILAKSRWVERSNGKTLLTDETAYWFGGDANSRWINCLIDFQATNGDIVFEDTKEGLFAIRAHPDLRLTADATAGVGQVFGNAINSAGDIGKEVWGKRAKWILYFGSIDGKPVSVAMFDHPSNLRHPTTWMARDYGLVAANPFGLHHFLGKDKGAGNYKVESGGRLQLRYRVEFFNSVVSPAQVEKKFQAFAKQQLSKPIPETADSSVGQE